jgi:hypothetical protein
MAQEFPVVLLCESCTEDGLRVVMASQSASACETGVGVVMAERPDWA